MAAVTAWLGGTLVALAPDLAMIFGWVAISVWVAYLAIKNPRFALAVYFLAICSNGVHYAVGGYTLRPEYVATPLLLCSFWLNRRFSFRISPVIIFGILSWMGIAIYSSVLLAPNAPASLAMWLQLCIAIAPVFLILKADFDRDEFVRDGTMILSAISLYSIVLWLDDRSSRISGLSIEPNLMGSLGAGWLGVVLYFTMAKGRMHGRYYVLCIPIVIAVLLTNTRAAWVALLLILAVAFVACAPDRVIAVVGLAFMGVGVLYGLSGLSKVIGNEDDWKYRLVHLADFSGGTGGYRVQLWIDAFEDIESRGLALFVGTGVNSFSQFHPVDPTGVSEAYLASLWIGLVYDVGLLGLISFGVVVFGLFSSVHARRYSLPLFVGLAICASITNPVWLAFPWLFMALVASARNSTDRIVSSAEGAYFRSKQVAGA